MLEGNSKLAVSGSMAVIAEPERHPLTPLPLSPSGESVDRVAGRVRGRLRKSHPNSPLFATDAPSVD